MTDNGVQVARYYESFAAKEADGVSDVYASWCRAVAADAELCDHIGALERRLWQPNLVFAAARYAGCPVGPGAVFVAWLRANWDAMTAIATTHATQTNEAARCAVLLPFLAEIAGPLALLEVGASAGLCLYPDRYGYRYTDDEGALTTLEPPEGSSVSIAAGISRLRAPGRLPDVVWRAGIDLNPLDVRSEADLAWLTALVWPEHHERRDRLHAAAEVVAADPPRLVRGDLVEELPALAAAAPEDATLVVFHTAVMPYLEAESREAFASIVRDLPGHWISNEGLREYYPGQAPRRVDAESLGRGFLVSVDGTPRGVGEPHGRWVRGYGD